MSGDGRGRAADEISTPARAGEFRKPAICGAPRGIASRGWKSAHVRNGGALPGKSLIVCGPGRALAQRSEPIRRRDGEKGRRRTSGKSFSCQKTGRLEGRPVFRHFWRRESPAVRRRGGGIVQDAQETAVAGPVLHAFPKPVPRPRFAGIWASLLLKAPRRCPAGRLCVRPGAGLLQGKIWLHAGAGQKMGHPGELCGAGKRTVAGQHGGSSFT